MKWRKETKTYCWASYYSEDGKWKAWDVDLVIKGGSPKKRYNPETKKMENLDRLDHVWKLQNIETGEILEQTWKTLKAAKEYAEQ